MNETHEQGPGQRAEALEGSAGRLFADERQQGRPLVSVVLPTRNRAGVLEGAVDSVLSQSFDDLELIVVDGASTDGTDGLVGSIEDPRLRYRRHDRARGVSAARNAGIREARGHLVAFIDADDRWREKKLQRQVAALAACGPSTAVAYCRLDKPAGEPRTRSGVSGEVREAVLGMQVPTYTSTLMVRREALRQAQGFDEKLGCFEDWELCLRLAEAWRFVFVDEPLVLKGHGGDNLSADPDRLAEAIEMLSTRHDLPSQARARLLTDAGRTFCEADRFEEGRSYLRRSLEQEPVQPMATLALLLSYMRSGPVYGAVMESLYATRRGWARVRRA